MSASSLFPALLSSLYLHTHTTTALQGSRTKMDNPALPFCGQELCFNFKDQTDECSMRYGTQHMYTPYMVSMWTYLASWQRRLQCKHWIRISDMWLC